MDITATETQNKSLSLDSKKSEVIIITENECIYKFHIMMNFTSFKPVLEIEAPIDRQRWLQNELVNKETKTDND